MNLKTTAGVAFTNPKGSDSTSAESVSSPTASPRWFSKFDAGILTILALPWVILRFDTTWLFGYASSSFGFIDPWVYFGYFFDLRQHLRAFKGAYFTTRLTWTVPGAVVYHLFPPIAATYILHLALFYGSSLALYLILRKTVGSRGAFLAVLLMAFHSYFLWSIGWPYIDGAGNTYILLLLAALTLASSSAYAKRWLILSGALAAMAVYCQFFLIVFFPLVFGYYYFARRETGNRRSPSDWKPFGLGFGLVTVAFGVFNMAVNGRFLFFINSVGTAAKLVVNHNPYIASTYGWLSGSTWLVLPGIALVGAILCLARRDKLLSVPNAEFLLFWLRYYVLSVAILVFWQLAGQPVLQLSTYASYLLPGVFLALGSQIAIVTHKLNRVQFALLCIVLAVIGLLPFLSKQDALALSVLKEHAILLPFGVGVIAIAAIASELRRAAVFAVLLLAVSLGMLNASTSTRTWDHGTLPSDQASQPCALLAIVDSIKTVQTLDPKGDLYFWYNGQERLGRLYRSVASTYLWAYRLQSETFPEFGPKAPPLQRRILILTEDPNQALQAAEDSLSNAGLHAEVLATNAIHEGPFHWEMVEIQVTRASSEAFGANKAAK